MSWLTVFHALIGSYLREEKGRTLLTILGVTLGVAVLVGIDLSNESAVESFRRNLRDVAGEATLSVRGNGSRFPAEWVGRIAGADGIEAYSPLLRGDLTVTEPSGRKIAVSLVGVDLLASGEARAQTVRPIALELEPGRAFTTLATDPSVLVFSQHLARRLALVPGDTVTLSTPALGEKPFTVGALIESGDLARAFGGNVILTDIGIADILLGSNGAIDQVDIVTSKSSDVEAVAAALRERLPADVLVERPEQRSARVDSMLAAFRFNLNALGQVSLLVGAFLIYNSMKISVVRRRGVIGTLRAMGVGRGGIRAAFLIEGALIGIIGGLLGVILGTVMAAAMVSTVSEAISINFVQTTGDEIILSPRILLGGLLLGVLFSVGAAVGPANEAATTPPANTMRRGTEEVGTRGIAWRSTVGFLLLLGAVLVLQRELKPGLPVIGYSSSLLLLGAGLFWSRPLLALVSRSLRGAYAALFGAEGLLASSSTESSLGRASVALNGLFLGVSMTIAVTIMVASFRETVTGWLGQVLVADLYLGPGAASGTAGLSREDVTALTDVEGIGRTSTFRSRTLVINGLQARVGGAEFDPVRFESTLVSTGNITDLIARAKSDGAVFVSETFASKHRLQAGDVLTLPTPKGMIEAPVVAVYRDYASEQGYVLMDLERFASLFEDDMIDSVAIHLEAGATPDAVREIISQRALERGLTAVDLRSNRDIRDSALVAFDQTFAVTYILQVIAMIVAVLGVATTLLAQLLDRRHEIITLRTLGADRWRVARVLVLEAGLIGIAGIVLGIAGGLSLAWILTTVVMTESFGWTIQFTVPWVLLLQTVALLFAATLVAGVGPAMRVLNGSAER